jgi:hypothetical protein
MKIGTVAAATPQQGVNGVGPPSGPSVRGAARARRLHSAGLECVHFNALSVCESECAD